MKSVMNPEKSARRMRELAGEGNRTGILFGAEPEAPKPFDIAPAMSILRASNGACGLVLFGMKPRKT